MNVRVRLGEPLWRAVGRREVPLTLPQDARVAEALAELARLHPALDRDLNNTEAAPMVFVNDQLADREHALSEAAVVQVVWPVSGGSGC